RPASGPRSSSTGFSRTGPSGCPTCSCRTWAATPSTESCQPERCHTRMAHSCLRITRPLKEEVMGSPVVHFEIMGTDGPALGEFYAELFGWKIQSMPEMDYT